MLDKIDHMISRVMLVGLYLSGIAILAMIFMIMTDVTLKTFFTSTIPGSYLFVQNYLMPIAFFAGLPYAFSTGIFPRLDILINKIQSAIMKMWVMASILIVELFFSLVITYYGIVMGLHGQNTNITFLSGTTSVPLYPFFFLISVGFGIMSIKMIIVIIRMIKSKGEYRFFKEVEEEELV